MLAKVTPAEFTLRFKRLFDQIFLPTNPRSDPWALPFRKDGWQVVALMALNDLAPREYRALVSAARSVGDGYAIMTDVEAEPRHQHAFCFSWPPDRLREAYEEGPYAVDAALFGPSGDWGVYFCWEPRIAYLGGTDRFMEVFLRETGGVEALKRGLKEMVDTTEDPPELEIIAEVLEHVAGIAS